MDLNDALKWVDTAVSNYSGYSGHVLREPEIIILKGTWRGLTYEQMASDSEYSTNYLMRDVAPKLWKQLSNVFDRSVGKTNFRVALEAYAAANPILAAEMLVSPEDAPSLRRLLSAQVSDAIRDVPSSVGFPAGGAGLTSTGRTAPGQTAPGYTASGQTTWSEANHGWLGEADGSWDTTGASLLSAASVLPGVMYGYAAPLEQVNHWLKEAAGTDGWSRLIGVWGLRGAGKTLLVETAVSQMGDRFEGVIWRSLHEQPTLIELSLSILASLGMSVSSGQATAKLLSVMANRTLLIVLEGMEAILKTGSLAGDYLTSHQTYVEFFQSVASSRSCLILTGIEGPADLVRQGGDGGNQSMRSLSLTGLDNSAATTLLEAERLFTPERWPELIERYQGHPLALKSTARMIREIFNGKVDAFLTQSSILFNGIFRLLSPSFERLSVPELNIIYWLASYDTPLSLAELQGTLPLSLRPAELISVLDSLKQRSLLTVTTDVELPTFHLRALVKAYAVHQFIEQFNAPSHDARNTPMRSGHASSYVASYMAPYVAPYIAPGQIINLSPIAAKPVQLSSWFAGQFDTDWQPLTWLFESAVRPATRLRSTYHLRDATFVKRCKAIAFNSIERLASTELASTDLTDTDLTDTSLTATDPAQKSPENVSRAVLLVAVHQDTEERYKVCVQAQPTQGKSTLPEQLTLKLLNAQKNTLATVVAKKSDLFIQLPYFRGGMAETFEIELSLTDQTHTETFVI